MDGAIGTTNDATMHPADAGHIMQPSGGSIALSKGDLVRLLSYLEGELQARDTVIDALKIEHTKKVLYQAKFGRLGQTDPLAALQRDSDACGSQNDFDETSVGRMYDWQLTQLERLVTLQKTAADRMRAMLAATERRHARVVRELESERSRHAADASQGDDLCVMLEKDRERLKSEMDRQAEEHKKLEKEIKKLGKAMDSERERHKAIVLFLMNERKQLIYKLAEERQHLKKFREKNANNEESEKQPEEAVEKGGQGMDALRAEVERLRAANQNLANTCEAQAEDIRLLQQNLIARSKEQSDYATPTTGVYETVKLQRSVSGSHTAASQPPVYVSLSPKASTPPVQGSHYSMRNTRVTASSPTTTFNSGRSPRHPVPVPLQTGIRLPRVAASQPEMTNGPSVIRSQQHVAAYNTQQRTYEETYAAAPVQGRNVRGPPPPQRGQQAGGQVENSSEFSDLPYMTTPRPQLRRSTSAEGHASHRIYANRDHDPFDMTASANGNVPQLMSKSGNNNAVIIDNNHYATVMHNNNHNSQQRVIGRAAMQRPPVGQQPVGCFVMARSPKVAVVAPQPAQQRRSTSQTRQSSPATNKQQQQQPTKEPTAAGRFSFLRRRTPTPPRSTPTNTKQPSKGTLKQTSKVPTPSKPVAIIASDQSHAQPSRPSSAPGSTTYKVGCGPMLARGPRHGSESGASSLKVQRRPTTNK